MRLGQLARKLALRPSQLVDYLATQQVFPEEGSNAKLTDELTEMIVLHFAPGRLAEIREADKASEQATEAVVERTETVIEIKEETPASPVAQPDVITETSSAEKPEVIKAPKIELSGLKVLGKIEIKEARKKAQQAAENAAAENQENTNPAVDRSELPGRKKKPLRKKVNEENSWRNPIALQREREAREAAEKRKKQAELEKEKRTINYQKRVKHLQPVKPAKIYREEQEEAPSVKRKSTEKPKGLIARFLHWLNS